MKIEIDVYMKGGYWLLNIKESEKMAVRCDLDRIDVYALVEKNAWQVVKDLRKKIEESSLETMEIKGEA